MSSRFKKGFRRSRGDLLSFIQHIFHLIIEGIQSQEGDKVAASDAGESVFVDESIEIQFWVCPEPPPVVSPMVHKFPYMSFGEILDFPNLLGEIILEIMFFQELNDDFCIFVGRFPAKKFLFNAWRIN